MLLNRGADPDLPNARGRSPAAHARELGEIFAQKVFYGITAEIDARIAEGHSIDAVLDDTDGKTKLMIECENGNCQMADFLISRGADPRKKDKTGKTAYDYARAYHPMSDKLVELLDKAGHISE